MSGSLTKIDLKIISSKHSFGNFSPNSAWNAIFWKISVVTSVMLVINPMKRRRWASIPFIPIPLMRGLYTTFQKILEYRSYGLPLLRKKSFELNEMFQGNTSKFAIFYVYENPHSIFFFILCNFFTFSLMNSLLYVNKDQGIHKGKSKVAQSQKWKNILSWFSYT